MNQQDSNDVIVADPNNNTLTVSHIGWTLRALLSAAARSDQSRRQWKVLYKGIVIGSVRIADRRPIHQTKETYEL